MSKPYSPENEGSQALASSCRSHGMRVDRGKTAARSERRGPVRSGCASRGCSRTCATPWEIPPLGAPLVPHNTRRHPDLAIPVGGIHLQINRGAGAIVAAGAGDRLVEPAEQLLRPPTLHMRQIDAIRGASRPGAAKRCAARLALQSGRHDKHKSLRGISSFGPHHPPIACLGSNGLKVTLRFGEHTSGTRPGSAELPRCRD
jgi:hypothetical protein